MNAHPIRHAWFSHALPKRKLGEFDSEPEWPSAYRPPSEPSLDSRPIKRPRHIEDGLARLNLKAKTSDELIVINPDTEPSPAIQIQDAPLNSEEEPSIYENASHTGLSSSSGSLPLRGEVFETNSSDEDMEERQMNGTQMGNRVFVEGKGMPGYTVYEPESGRERRKRRVGEEAGLKKTGNRTWYEPEKDRIVVLDLDCSDDESVIDSPRRSSLASTSQVSSTRPDSQEDSPEFIINSTLLSNLSRAEGVPSIPREETPGLALVLYKPAPWDSSAPRVDEPEITDIEDAAVGSGPVSMEASPIIRDRDLDDDDAMDIDS